MLPALCRPLVTSISITIGRSVPGPAAAVDQSQAAVAKLAAAAAP